MNRERLTKVMIESLNPNTQNYIEARKTVANLPADIAESLFIHEVSKPIEEVVLNESPFKGGQGYLVARDNGYSGFYAHEVSIALTHKFLRGQSPSSCIDWLEKVLTAKEGLGFGIMALWGIEVNTPISFSNNVTLIPFDMLPTSNIKAWILSAKDFSVYPGFRSPLFASSPRAALLCSHLVKPFIYSTALGEPPLQPDPLYVHRILDDCRQALSLIGPSCPISAGYWFQFDDADLNEASFYSGVTISHMEVTPWDPTLPAPLDPDESREVVNRFLALGEPLRGKLRLALERLNQALRRRPNGDKALDLSIALEILLVDGSGENTYKVGLRAALLLDAPLEEKIYARSITGGLYTLRSALVHDGVLPPDVKLVRFGKKPSYQVIADAAAVCSKVIRSILFRGEIPDWYSLELNPINTAESQAAYRLTAASRGDEKIG